MSINKTLEWFKAAVPNTDNKTLSVQIGCHLEEVVEMLDALEISNKVLLEDAAHSLTALAEALKSGRHHIEYIDDTEMLDSLADQIVTATGVAHMLSMDIVGALDEVNRSNFSKFEDGKPVFLDGGKIGKGKDYVAPDLAPYLSGGDV